MNVTVEILGRSTMDGPFVPLVAPAVLAVPGASLGYTPALPAGAAAMDLRLRVLPDNGMNVDVGTAPAPAPVIEDGEQTGVSPVPAFVVSKTFGVWGRQPKDIAFLAGQTFQFRPSGATTGPISERVEEPPSR